MIKKIGIFCMLLGVLFVVSCQEATSDAQLKYEEELQLVLDGHDELMAEMPQLNKLIQQLENQGESSQTETENALKQLKEAHKSMFDWMHDFSEEFPDIHKKDKEYSEEEYKDLTKALKKQAETLERLENDFDQSMGNAENALKKQ